jgi:hypothetical protein
MEVIAERVKLTLDQLNGWQMPKETKRGARREGLHEGDLVRAVAIRGGLLKVDKDKEDVLDPVLLCCGLAWECWAAGLYQDMMWQPPEVEYEGVLMNMDGLSYTDSGELVVEEFKFTRKSAWVGGEDRRIEGEWRWLAQVKNYCKAMGGDEGGCTRGRLHVMYVNGNYRFKDGGGPQYWRYDLQFTQQEVDDNWQVMQRAAERLAKEGKGGK